MIIRLVNNMRYKVFFRLGTRLKIFFYSRIGTQFAKIIFRSIIQQAQEISALCLCLCPAQLQQNQTALFSSEFPWNPNWPGSAAVEPSEMPQNSLQGTIEMSFRLCQKQETLIGHRVSASKQCVLIFEEIPIRDMWQDPQFTHERGQGIACSTGVKVELCCRRASWNWSWNSSRWSEMHFSQCMWQFEIFCAYFQHAAHTCCTQAATPALTHTYVQGNFHCSASWLKEWGEGQSSSLVGVLQCSRQSSIVLQP